MLSGILYIIVKIVWFILVMIFMIFGLTLSRAYAEHPLITDDTGTQSKGKYQMEFTEKTPADSKDEGAGLKDGTLTDHRGTGLGSGADRKDHGKDARDGPPERLGVDGTRVVGGTASFPGGPVPGTRREVSARRRRPCEKVFSQNRNRVASGRQWPRGTDFAASIANGRLKRLEPEDIRALTQGGKKYG